MRSRLAALLALVALLTAGCVGVNPDNPHQKAVRGTCTFKLTATLQGDDTGLTMGTVTYRWSVPRGVRVDKTFSFDTLTIRTAPGDYDVTVSTHDSRDNSDDSGSTTVHCEA